VRIAAPLTHFVRVTLHEREDGQLGARLTGPQGSGLLTSMARADALLVIADDAELTPAGSVRRALPAGRRRAAGLAVHAVKRRAAPGATSAASATPLDDGGLTTLERSLRRRFRVVESVTEIAGEPYSLLHPASAEELISEEDFDKDERLPYWADLWPSSHVLATRVRSLAGEGRRCLELGCGAGLVTCAASRAGWAVTATDYYLDALRFTAVNARRVAGVAVATREVDWRALPEDLPRCDLVLAADVLYERPYGALVAQAIARSLAPEGIALLADPGRVGAADFDREAVASGLVVQHIARVEFHTGVALQRIDIRLVRAA
jgi:ETFB lysine methyltransferase